MYVYVDGSCVEFKGDFSRCWAGTAENVNLKLDLLVDSTREKKEFTVTSSILKSKSQGLNFYLKEVEDDLEINLSSSFQFRDVFRFENAAFWISELSPCVTPWY